MYQVNDTTYAIEDGDRIKFIKDGDGELSASTEDMLISSEEITIEVLDEDD